MKIRIPMQKKTFMVVCKTAIAILALFVVAKAAYSDPRWYQPTNTQETPVINNYVTEVTEINEILEYNYTPDHCQGVAIAQAGANNMMHMGTKKPQLSLGLGECGGEVASSLMFGMRINPTMMINGSWATDENVDAYGLGLHVVFQ